MIFENTIISPNKYDGHTSGPIIDYGPFRLCRGGNVIDDPATIDTITNTIDEAVWGGFIHTHFGHFIPEHTTRLIHNDQLPVIFVNYFDTTPQMFYDICELFNITPLVCNTPTIVRKLTIRPQMEQYTLPNKCIFPSDRYIAMLDSIPHKSSAYTNVFVSRGKVRIGMAGVAGERIIERAFAEKGYYIMYPDTMSLLEQLSIYKNASNIVMTEGSALYGLQLLGNLGHITIISRRPNYKMNWQSLIKRAKSLRYVNAVTHIESIERCSRRDMAVINPDVLNAACHINIDQKLYYAYAKSDIQMWRNSDIIMPPCQQTMCEFIGCK